MLTIQSESLAESFAKCHRLKGGPLSTFRGPCLSMANWGACSTRGRLPPSNTAVPIIIRLESSHSFAQKLYMEKYFSFSPIGFTEKYSLSQQLSIKVLRIRFGIHVAF
jgi:hypothetical protein